MTACTALRASYNKLDWLASWELSKYVSLDADQKQRFNADFGALWIWHRHSELARYTKDLRELAQAATQPLTAAQITTWTQRVDGHWDRLVAKAAPAACVQMAAFSDAQVTSVLRRLDRNISKQADELVTPPEATVRNESQKRLLKTLRRWLGDLSDAQLGRVANWSAQREMTYAHWLDQRRLWRDRFAKALAIRHSATFCAQVEQLFTRTGQPPGDGFYTRYDGNRERWMDFLSQLSTTLSTSQRQHMRSELQKLAEDFETLAAEPPH